MSSDDLGDRMKLYEGQEAKRAALPRLPVLVRVDGKCFSTWTRGLEYPFDERLEACRVETTTALVKEMGAVIGYHQSDEISLVLAPQADGTVYCSGRFQKLCSHAASIATAVFNEAVRPRIPEKAHRPAMFDARAWVVPSEEEAVNTLIWREWDATKNSISMAAHAVFSHRDLHEKKQTDLFDMLLSRGINWNDYPAWAKRGTYIGRRSLQRRLSAEELESLPPKHNARKNPDLVVERSVLQELHLPPLARVSNRLEVVFRGAAPLETP